MNPSPIPVRSEQDRAKLAAGRFAAEQYCFNGAKLGLGSGTTSHYFVRALVERVREGLEVIGATTSTSTRDLAVELGVPLVDIDEIDQLDVCIDGPDEVDQDGTQIKGGGACLLWEKLVVLKSAKSVVVADHSKAVSELGRFPLPIEIIRYAPGTTTQAVRDLLVRHGYAVNLEIIRRKRDGRDVITDNGNYIIDAHLERARDIGELTVELNSIPGVVENGFFHGIADEIVFGWPDGSAGVFDFPLTLPVDLSNAVRRNET